MMRVTIYGRMECTEGQYSVSGFICGLLPAQPETLYRMISACDRQGGAVIFPDMHGNIFMKWRACQRVTMRG